MPSTSESTLVRSMMATCRTFMPMSRSAVIKPGVVYDRRSRPASVETGAKVRNEMTLVAGFVENRTAPPVDVPFEYRTSVTSGWLSTFFVDAGSDARRVDGSRACDFDTSLENQRYSSAS